MYTLVHIIYFLHAVQAPKLTISYLCTAMLYLFNRYDVTEVRDSNGSRYYGFLTA